jgi:hypothetical protein
MNPPVAGMVAVLMNGSRMSITSCRFGYCLDNSVIKKLVAMLKKLEKTLGGRSWLASLFMVDKTACNTLSSVDLLVFPATSYIFKLPIVLKLHPLPRKFANQR